MGKFHDFLWHSSRPEFTLYDSVLISKMVLKFYRFFALCCMLAIYIYNSREVIYGFRFLTRWGIFYVTLYFILVSICHIKYKDDKAISRKDPYALWKYANIIGVLAFSMQILIPPFYWYFVYPTDVKSHTTSGFIHTFTAHAVTAAFIYVEVLLSKIKFLPRHAVIVVSFGAIYMGINFIATKIMGKPVYPNITYESIATLFTLMGALGGCLVGFSLGLILTKLKTKKVSEQSDYYGDYAEGDSSISPVTV